MIGVAWLLRACPKCGGDLFYSPQIDGSMSRECLQCGYEHSESVAVYQREGYKQKRLSGLGSVPSPPVRDPCFTLGNKSSPPPRLVAVLRG